MTRLVAAELLKVRTTRIWWGLALAVVALVALSVVLSAVFAGQQGAPGLETDAAVANVWSGTGAANTFALVIGILLMAGEYRHATIGSTFLAEPRRSRVVLAKLVAAGGVGLGYGLIACVVTAALAVPLLATRNATGSADEVAILAGALLVSVLYALLGAGLGALVRNQVPPSSGRCSGSSWSSNSSSSCCPGSAAGCPAARRAPSRRRSRRSWRRTRCCPARWRYWCCWGTSGRWPAPEPC